MKPGDKVVCVGNEPCRCFNQPNNPVAIGTVCVVRTVELDKGVLYLKLVGVAFPPDDRHQTDWLEARDFRLLDELKQEARLNQQADTGLTKQQIKFLERNS